MPKTAYVSAKFWLISWQNRELHLGDLGKKKPKKARENASSCSQYTQLWLVPHSANLISPKK
jgi:hypothetical protein